jgi:putative oxidoreductase
MKWAVLIVRILVGGMFVFASVSYFGKFMEQPTPPTEHAQAFGKGLSATAGSSGFKYMDVVKVLELVGGLLVLSGRLAPLGLTLLVPVTVNIALWDIFLVGLGNGPPVGLVLLALEVFLLVAYRQYFAWVFTTSAQPGF